MVRHGATDVMAPTRSIAQNFAGRDAIREFHAGPGARYTHFHTADRNGSHIWYGRPRWLNQYIFRHAQRVRNYIEN